MLECKNVIDACGGRHSKVRDIDEIKYIVIHRFGWNDLRDYDANGISPNALGAYKFYQSNGEAYIATGGRFPYTFMVGQGGLVWQTSDIGVVTPHAMRWNVPGLGIACFGDFTLLPPTNEQMGALTELLAALVRYLGDVKVVGHTELPGSTRDPNKDCPGRNLNMDKLRSSISNMNDGLAAQSLIRLGIAI